ncbi:putative septin aspE [Coleophoma cylindrospora]|uniref:Putative septin aspE n=1 Tax=Coleophoma cylindrospora TaxID=1849047 RepID=A0A3D8R1H3_9HELO|nr:putative septin aspE [Coleophoma cylindrospora]
MVSATRPRTPSGGTTPSAADKLQPIPESLQPRRSSLGLLLRRSKSTELRGNKKQKAQREAELLRQQKEAASIPKSPPRLPDLYNGSAPPKLQSFGGEDRPDSVAIVTGRHNGGYVQGRVSMEPVRSQTATSSVPIPPIPKTDEWVDPYARTESMTHRGRYSYASSAVSSINSPRRVRRRKDPTPFNILILGARSAGKTSFLEFLKTSLALPAKKRGNRPTELAEDIFAPPGKKSGNFTSHYLETEIDGERVGLTLWDSEGLEKNVVDLQLREMSSFLEAKFEETFTEEMKVVRAPGVQDTHIHCAFLILDPVRLDRNIAASKSTSNGANGKYGSEPRLVGGLDEDLDLSVLRTLQGKTTVVPVISKADTITTAHMNVLKKTVWDSLRKANIDPLEALGLDDDGSESPRNSSRIEEGDEESEDNEDADGLPIQSPEPVQQSSPKSNRISTGSLRKRQSDSDESTEVPYLPLSIISPDIYEPLVLGRKFPWGFADPMNEEHCDFPRLKEAVFSEWRGELKEASRELWYEGWRTSRLKHREPQR